MDFDQVADQLYALPPPQFTAARNTAADQAREQGDPGSARRILGLRRPTLGAWLANLLVREHPTETRGLLELGGALRAAQAELDGEQLRELTVRRRAVVSALVRQAKAAAVRAGRAVGQSTLEELEETLLRVLADESAARAFATGRLTSSLSAGTVTEAPTADPSPAPERRVGGRGDAGPSERQLAMARQDAEEARRAAEAAEEAAKAARRELERAATRHRAAERKVQDLTARLEQARLAERKAAAEARVLRERAASTDRTQRRAAGRARDAEIHLRHLTTGRSRTAAA